MLKRHFLLNSNVFLRYIKIVLLQLIFIFNNKLIASVFVYCVKFEININLSSRKIKKNLTKTTLNYELEPTE